MTVIEPPPERSKIGTRACNPNATPSTFTPLARSYKSKFHSPGSSGVRSKSAGSLNSTPAFRIAISSWSKSLTAVAHDSAEVTSNEMKFPPTSLATSRPLVSSTSQTKTSAPSDAANRAVAAPMPEAPPVISTTLLSRSQVWTSGSSSNG